MSHEKIQKRKQNKTHCDQGVHNIFTGLQAGATRHLQEQLFGRLSDLHGNISNSNF